MRYKLAAVMGLLAIVYFTSCSRTPEDEVYFTHVSGFGKIDYSFATGTARRNYAQIELGKLAFEKSGDVRVKSFAGVMVKEHESLQSDLSAKISANNWPVTLPGATESYPTQTIQYLQQFSGYSFDTAYMNYQSQTLQYYIGDFTTEIKQGAVLFMVNWATKWLPRVVLHKETVDSLQVQLMR